MNGISQAQLGTVECLKDDPARGEVGCNPTLGHHQDCQRFNPRDPKAQMRERMRGAMTGAGMGAPGTPGMMGMPGMVPTLAAQHQMAAHQMGYGPSPYAAPSQAAYPIGVDVLGQQPQQPQGYGAPMPSAMPQLPAGFPPGAFAGMYGHAPGALPPGALPHGQPVPSATVAAVHSAVTSRSERLFQAALHFASAAFDGNSAESGEDEEKMIKDSTRRAKLLVDGVESIESAK